MSENLATGTRWLCQIPLKSLFSDLGDNFSLNLTTFSIPEISIGVTSLSYGGVSIEFPNRVANPDGREITFSYMVSSDYAQYMALYRWVDLITTESLVAGSNDANAALFSASKYKLPVTVVMLSEYKKPILKVSYKDCFIKGFGPLDLDYQGDDENIQHEFTLAYAGFEVEKL